MKEQDKIAPEDEGDTNLTIRHYRGKLVLEFKKKIAWLALDPQEARDLAGDLITEANRSDFWRGIKRRGIKINDKL